MNNEPPITLTGDALDLTAATMGEESVSPRTDPFFETASVTQAKELQQKVGFLESKLLEYEIVQEEIANLSLLKLENEKLREEIVKLKRNLTALPSTKEEMTDPASLKNLLF